MKRAQLVLTGGPSLYELKRGLHRNVHCFPSAVDAEHFQPARNANEWSVARHNFASYHAADGLPAACDRSTE